ncbi:nuclease harbi1 [Lasius niger]|uniref:Nuclease harbi1 n=1 Tax=Lasius niger TaxID=67767 RepID=A0A0J7K5J7_LASNI|nr:nuclease harbi1 [Lasius niger]
MKTICVSVTGSAKQRINILHYKGHHSINLLGISDAKYCFTIVDIGAEGRQSDGGVFRNSEIGKRFEVNSFKLPNPKQIEIDGPELPYVLVADKAFPLSMYMMRPHPRSGKLDIGKKIFNYRISRARRVVENAFGMLVTRWRIYRRPIIANVSNVRKIVQATVALHNFIIKNEEQLTGNKSYLHITSEDARTSHGVCNIPLCRGRNNNNAVAVREAYSKYFQGTVALPYQWVKALQNDF